MADQAHWERCGVALIQSWDDRRVWSPVLEGMDIAQTLVGAAGLNKAKRYAIQEARRFGHIGPETVQAHLRWVQDDTSAVGQSTLELEVRVQP